MSDAVRIDGEFVRHWSDAYPFGDKERRLLDVVGPAVAQRGYYQRDELVAVGTGRALGMRAGWIRTR